MKKFKKIIAMCLTAVMALSMMSVGAFASETEMVTETVNTYVEDENGNIDLISVEVEVDKNANKEEKNEAYMRAAYYAAYGEEMPQPKARATYYFGDFYVGVNNSNAGGTNGTAIGTVSALGTNGFAILISESDNLLTYNLSFENVSNYLTWYDTGLQLNVGATIYFANGKRSNATGDRFVYTQGNRYTIRVSGQKADLDSNAYLGGSVYSY